MAYIPPYLRNKSKSDVKVAELPPRAQKPSDGNLMHHEIDAHFWPVNEEGDLDDPHSSFPEYHGKTLHGSRESPDKLAYVMMYFEANPRWETDQIIFTKSSLDLLPKLAVPIDEDQADAGAEAANVEAVVDFSPTTKHEVGHEDATRPIAMFKQMTSRENTSGFQFEGWYNIERIAFLEPHSPELVRMLEQKWARTDFSGNAVGKERRGVNWQKSLSHRWAIVKFSRDDVVEKERGPPQIERLPGRGRRVTSSGTPKKSVNEMLAEMRLKESGRGTGDGNGDAAIEK